MMLLRILVVGVLVRTPNAELSHVRMSLDTENQGQLSTDILTQRHRSNYFAELEAINRHERQIRFKESYQDLPKGIPVPRSNVHKHDGLSYFVQEKPSFREPFSRFPEVTSTYFPPEVMQLESPNSIESRGDSGSFFTFGKAQDNQDGLFASEKIAFITGISSQAGEELSPFYIPSQNTEYDTVHFTSPEMSIYLAKDLSGIPSHSIQPSSYPESPEINHVTEPATSLIPPSILNFPLKLKAPSFPKEVHPLREKDLTFPVPYQSTPNPFISPSITTPSPAKVLSATSIPLTPDSDIPIFIIEHNDLPNSNTQFGTSFSADNSINKNKFNHEISGISHSLSVPKTVSNGRTASSEESYSSVSRRQKSRRRNKQGRSNGKGKIPRTLNDYTTFHTLPGPSFDCSTKVFGGYYADPETNCQVFHVCLGTRSAAFVCPTGTLFNQKLLVCDWKYKVECPKSILPNFRLSAGSNGYKRSRRATILT